MSNFKYTITELDGAFFDQRDSIKERDRKIIESFSVNSVFDQSKNRINLTFYTSQGQPISTDFNFTGIKGVGDTLGDGISEIEFDPIKNAVDAGYENGDVILEYDVINNPYIEDNRAGGGTFFIESISADRLELRAIPLDIPDEKVSNTTDLLLKKLNDDNQFESFNVNLLDQNRKSIGLNIGLDAIENKGIGIAIKLYEPLPSTVELNDTISIEEKIADSYVVEVSAEVVADIIKPKTLKGPNFDIELVNENNNPTEFLDYNELFSYPVTSSYYELYSLFNEKSAQVSIDHSDYESFIHFSSAEERLRNFKYKLDLIDSYQVSAVSASMPTLDNRGISGSAKHYNDLITGVVKNFDHYDRYLFYESGSYAWPKTTAGRPFKNQVSTTNESIAFFSRMITSASNFDTQNVDVLTNTIPAFIKEDPNNEQYQMFIHMVGQHFDNIWIYFKSVSDKYDADNRLDFGVSKDIVRNAVQNFGISLYNSPKSLSNLFSQYIGEGYISGSELITSHSVATSGSANQHLQPMPQADYQKEIYKRIYHNIPYLLKTKGTERGLRALINCYGIPDNILQIITEGGQYTRGDKYLGPTNIVTGSLEKIRLDNTGSLVTGSALSQYTSIQRKDNKYSDDIHRVFVGFDMSEPTNKWLKSKLSSSFNIDQYIGDPGLAFSGSYDDFNALGDQIANTPIHWEDIDVNWEQADFTWQEFVQLNTGNHLYNTRDPFAFVRLIKFFDTSLFRMVKDFVPARANVKTGIIIKPHILNRSKAKQVEAYVENKIYTGSLKIGAYTGSDGGIFPYAASQSYTTNYSGIYYSPLGPIDRNVTDEAPRFTGEFSGSGTVVTNGDLQNLNPFRGAAQPLLTFDLRYFNASLPTPPACDIVLSATILGNIFHIGSNDKTKGSVKQTFPTSIGVSEVTGSFSTAINFNSVEFGAMVATATYPNTFTGWYHSKISASGGTLVTQSNTLTIYSNTEQLLQTQSFFAQFS